MRKIFMIILRLIMMMTMEEMLGNIYFHLLIFLFIIRIANKNWIHGSHEFYDESLTFKRTITSLDWSLKVKI